MHQQEHRQADDAHDGDSGDEPIGQEASASGAHGDGLDVMHAAFGKIARHIRDYGCEVIADQNGRAQRRGHGPVLGDAGLCLCGRICRLVVEG